MKVIEEKKKCCGMKRDCIPSGKQSFEFSQNIRKNFVEIVDFVTGKNVPLVGAEENRQIVEKFLVEKCNIKPEEICVDEKVCFEIDGEEYCGWLDLVVKIGNIPVMVVKCASGSIYSREREVLAGCRIVAGGPALYGVVSTGSDAVVIDCYKGKKIGSGMDSIPRRESLVGLEKSGDEVLKKGVIEKAKLIFRAYDKDNVNVGKKL